LVEVKKKKIKQTNVLLIAITLILYIINQFTKTDIINPFIKWFMCCYYNDIIGSITFASYVNLVCSYREYCLSKLWQIELLLLGSGIFWEYVTPIFRKNTVTDIWDLFAYLFGGFLYWLIIKKPWAKTLK